MAQYQQSYCRGIFPTFPSWRVKGKSSTRCSRGDRDGKTESAEIPRERKPIDDVKPPLSGTTLIDVESVLYAEPHRVRVTGTGLSSMSSAAAPMTSPDRHSVRTGSSLQSRHPSRRSSQQMALELAFAVAARAVLVLSPLGPYLQDDNQLSSPLTSYSRRKPLAY